MADLERELATVVDRIAARGDDEPDQAAKLRRGVIISQHNTRVAAYEKEEKIRIENRRAGYKLIRSLTSEALNEQLAVSEAFIATAVDDPKKCVTVT